MRSFGEVLNDIRQDKNVSVAQIEKLGISKSRWYRIAVGEAELSLKELTDVLTLLTMTFSELAIAVGTPLLRPYSIVSLFSMPLPKLAEAVENERIGAADGPDDYALLAAEIVQDLRTTGDINSDSVAKLTTMLLETENYTLMELNIAGLLAALLGPADFMVVYQRYVRTITMFTTYLPIDIWGIATQMHIQAIKKFLMVPANRSRENTRFILEAIINQPTASGTVELLMLKRLAIYVRDDEAFENPMLDGLVNSMLEAAEREQALTIGLEPSDLNLRKVWDAYRSERETYWRPAENDHHFPVFAAGTELPYFNHFGKLFQWIMAGKNITVDQIEAVGISAYKLKRAYKDPDLLHLSDLECLMRQMRLIPADLDASIKSQFINTEADTWVQYTPELTAPGMYHVMAEVARHNYERTKNHLDLEISFRYRAMDGMANYPGWLTSDDAVTLGHEIMDVLMGMDVWHERELRLIKYGILGINSVAETEVWQRQFENIYTKTNAPYALLDNILEALELATFRAALLENRELVQFYTTLSRQLGTQQVRDGSLALQWRWIMLDFFEIIFDNPQRVIRLLSHYIVDYQTMTGDSEAVGRFRTILQALVERENPSQA